MIELWVDCGCGPYVGDRTKENGVWCVCTHRHAEWSNTGQCEAWVLLVEESKGEWCVPEGTPCPLCGGHSILHGGGSNPSACFCEPHTRPDATFVPDED